MNQTNSIQHVIKNRGFLNLWINQILVQLSYNSLNFALVIWVYHLTGSNIAVSVLLVSVYLPAVLFGLFAGVFVDVTDRRKIIMGINIVLIFCFIGLAFLKFSFPAILLLTFIINTMAQFYIPAESSAIPLIVKKEQLMLANSIFSTTLFLAFLLGFGLAGPLINHLSVNMVFGLGVLFLGCAFILAIKFPSIVNKSDPQGKKLIKALQTKDIKSIGDIGYFEILHTFRLIKGRIIVMASILILAAVQAVIGILAVLIPAFMEKVIQINATDASYVLIIPLGLGMVLGALIIGKYGHKLTKRKLVGGGIIVAGLLLFMVGIAPLISPVINYLSLPKPLPFFYQPSLSVILAVGSFLLGLAMVSIMVPSQTVLQENTPEQDRGKVFAVLGVIMSALSLIPVLFTGILADVFGALPIFIALGGSIALIGLLALKPDFYFTEKQLPYKLREFLGLGHWEK